MAVDPDVLLVLGVLLLALSIPAFFVGLVAARLSGRGVVMLLAGGGLVWTATLLAPRGYALADVPEAVIRVIARLFY